MAVLFALLVGVVWFFFFRTVDTTPSTTGNFGTGSNKTTSTTGITNNTNNIPSNTLPTGTTGASTGAGGQSYGGQTFSTTGVGGVDAVPGVAWLGGSGFVGGGGAGGPTTNFVPKTINQLNDGTVGGTPGIIGSFGGTDVGGGGNNGFGAIGLAVGAAGCAMLGVFKAAGEAQAAGETAAGGLGGMVLVIDWRLNAKQAAPQYKDFGDCIMRTIAKAVLQQITSSIVNWINSGFNGKPSFVTNFNQFFNNVGDQAAGEFIRGTGLSFLCSPFQLQIRIAIAQSYARRGAASCTLTGVIKNINSFMNGNFSQGGWGGLLQFTTIPTNNPFGAYAYAQIGLQSSINSAQNNARNNLSPGGFISLQKCDPPGSKNCKVTTPGTIIEGTLEKSLNIGQEQLAQIGVSGSFDAIVSALLTQLTTKVLYQGLSTLSGTNGYAANYLTPEQQKAQTDAQVMLNQLQGYLQVAQQYGSVQQGSISDIQNTQQQLHTLFDCYSGKGKTAEASSTQEIITNYDNSIAAYNANITKANQGIALLQDLQTQTINVASAADVSAVKSRFNDALASGAIISQADFTNASQDRTTLQSYLAGRNSATAADLQQCNAL